MQPNSNSKCWIGIDVSRDWVDVVILRQQEVMERKRWDRTEPSLTALAEHLSQWLPQGVVLEPTGGLDAAVIAALLAAGLPVMRINPKRVRDFARAQGLLAKTDALDAYALALFGQRMQPPLRPWPEAEQQQLVSWVRRLRQLTLQRAAERNRLRRATEPELIASVKRVIAFLTEELERLEQQLESWMAQSQSWQQQQALLRTAPGVGPKTARMLLAYLPDWAG